MPPALPHTSSAAEGNTRQSAESTIPSSSLGQPAQELPPATELEAIVNTFFATVFQIGFLHKIGFMKKLRQNPSEISRFLLFSILATSAADTPAILEKTGSRTSAIAEGQTYFEKAVAMAFDEIAEPSLERIQAFYLLAQQDWMDGRGSRSWIFMGIGIRLASLLGLEKNESYHANSEASPEILIAEEEARRT